jgi:hypothetical protein
MDDGKFEAHVARVQEYWSHSSADQDVYNREMPLRVRLRELQRANPKAALRGEGAEIVERLRAWGETDKAPWHLLRRALSTFLGLILGIFLVALPLIAWFTAAAVRDCGLGIWVPGLQVGAQHVELFKPSSPVPEEQYAEEDLMLLGGDTNRYILYDCSQKAILRVPTSDHIVVTFAP